MSKFMPGTKNNYEEKHTKYLFSFVLKIKKIYFSSEWCIIFNSIPSLLNSNINYVEILIFFFYIRKHVSLI